MFLTSPGSRNGEKCTFCEKVHFWVILAPGGRRKRLRLSLYLARGANGAHFSEKVHFLHFGAPRGAERSLNPRRARAAGGGPLPRAGTGRSPFPKCALCPRLARGGARSLNARSAPGGPGAEAVP